MRHIKAYDGKAGPGLPAFPQWGEALQLGLGRDCVNRELGSQHFLRGETLKLGLGRDYENRELGTEGTR